MSQDNVLRSILISYRVFQLDFTFFHDPFLQIYHVNAQLSDCISSECYASDNFRTTKQRKCSNLFDPVCLEQYLHFRFSISEKFRVSPIIFDKMHVSGYSISKDTDDVIIPLQYLHFRFCISEKLRVKFSIITFDIRLIHAQWYWCDNLHILSTLWYIWYIRESRFSYIIILSRDVSWKEAETKRETPTVLFTRTRVSIYVH